MKASLKKQPYDVEHRILVDRKVKWVREKAEFEFNEKDECVRATGVTQDITEKKQTETDLQKSGERYRQLVEDISEQVWEVDANGIYTYISPRALDVYGCRPEDVIGKTPFDFMPADEAQRVAAIFNTIREAKKPFWKLDNTVQHADGRLLYMETTGLPFFDSDGKFMGYRGTSADMTERKQLEKDTQALVESTVGKIGKELFDTVVVKICDWLECDFATIGEITSDRNIKVISMVLDGQPVADPSYPLDGSPCDEVIRNEYCVFSENVCDLFPKDTGLAELGANGYVGTTLKDQEGKVIGVLCGISRNRINTTKQTQNILRIIAARVSAEIEREKSEKENIKLESQLQQAQKMEAIGTLAGGIAHDFNNILFPIVGHTEILLEDVSKDGPLRDSLNEIYTASLRARELVQQILSFSRQGKSELKLIKIQIIIKEALKLIRSTIPTTISINQNLQPECGAVNVDPTQIHQIVMNLATNAYHAMEENGGELKVVLKEIELSQHEVIPLDLAPGPYACLTVADTGKGMTKDVRDNAFKPFFTTKEKGKGTGMGLSVVHGIVKSMNGSIQLHSEPGCGTEFQIFLPIVKSAFEKQDTQTKEPVIGGSESVLLVDDEKSIIAMGRQALERLGYQVTTRTSGIEALEVFRANPDKFDLVITDMAMPKISGDKLAFELMKIRSDIPVLLCTGFSENMTDEKIKSLGIKGLLIKPMVIKYLAKKIREVLD